MAAPRPPPPFFGFNNATETGGCLRPWLTARTHRLEKAGDGGRCIDDHTGCTGKLTMLVTAVDSTTLAMIAYDAAHQTLWLEFRSGAVYVYSSVPPDVYQALLVADSRGAYFNRHVRGRFPYFRQLNKLLTALPTSA